MPSFAAVRTEYGPDDWSQTTGGADNQSPVPFWDSVQRRVEDTTRTQWEGAREEAVLVDFWERHREIERRLKVKLKVSDFMSGQATAARDPLKRFMDQIIPVDDWNARLEGRPGVLDDDAYEAQLDRLRREHPREMADISTREEMLTRRQREWEALRASADQAADSGVQGQLGSIAGGIGGTMMDPRQAGMALATGGWGVGRSLLLRMGAQSAVGAGTVLLEGGDRVSEAQRFGGPQVTAGDIATEAAFAGIGGAAFEAGGDALKWATRPARRAIGLHREPADRGIARALEAIERDEAVVGAMPFDLGRDSLAAGGPAPLRRADPGGSPGAQSVPPVAGWTAAPIGGRPAYLAEFRPDALGLDPLRFGQGSGEAPLVARAWKPDEAGQALVFEDRGGALIVADGRRRLDLAAGLIEAGKGLEPRINAVVLREADGWSAREARFLATVRNFRGDDPVAQARAMRSAPELIDSPNMPTTGDPALVDARAIARLSDSAFAEVEAGRIPDGVAVSIGEVAAGRPDTHAALVDLMATARPRSGEDADALAHEALLALLGDDLDDRLLIARGRLRGALARELRGDPDLLAQLARQADAMDAAGLALSDTAAAQELAATGVAARLAWSEDGVDPFTAAASRVARGEVDADEAAKALAPELRSALAEVDAAQLARREAFTPAPPSQLAQRGLDVFDVRGGAGPKAQIKPKPEDAVLEGFNVIEARQRVDELRARIATEGEEAVSDELAQAEAALTEAARLHDAAGRGLFKDLGDDDAVALERAITRLLPCVPGGG